ncbi:zinc finger, CCHC-type containing protein [Tanacetum coccineum]|uniref:Zinc finger, CCHC-type containing protein n=1 Tax=Tanacetum coccineum TaxID=301880 RepID=A0ABQ5G2Q4_9ASTR
MVNMVPHEAFACSCAEGDVVLRQSYKPESYGKLYYACPKSKPPKHFGCGFFLWKETRLRQLMSSPGAPSTPSYSAGHSTPPSYSSGPSTPPSYSSGPSTPTNYSLGSSRNRECSNCKHLRGKIRTAYGYGQQRMTCGNMDIHFTSRKKLTLMNVLHVPNIRKNLVSGFKLCKSEVKAEIESDKAFETFKIYKAQVENQRGKKIQILRRDRGGEYFFTEFSSYCESHGLIHQRTTSYTPQQNGVAERKNRVLQDMINAMLVSANLPKNLWGEVLLIACHERILKAKRAKTTKNRQEMKRQDKSEEWKPISKAGLSP